MGDPKELKALLEKFESQNDNAASDKSQPATPKEYLRYALEKLKEEKPNDRSEIDRRYAICITEMEKVIGYYVTWIAIQP